MLDAVRDATANAAEGTTGGITALDVAQLVHLHVTTVRFHLERLVGDGLVVGEVVSTGGRGRPHVEYRAVALSDARAAMLAAVTDVASGEGPVAVRARQAGQRWADSLALDVRDAASALTEVFASLGFAPEPVGDAMHLRACPFRDEARRHPEVVCGVHQGLAAGIARRAGMEARLTMEPEVCVLEIGPED